MVRDKQCGMWAALAMGLWVSFVGCTSTSSSSGNAAPPCDQYCTDFCVALSNCTEPPADCQERCEAGVAGEACSGSRPPDQLQCSELSKAFACADYCGAICERAPSCGASFDARACAIGCAESSPPVCNAASVEPRSCDQLKPELRRYTDLGHAELNRGPGEDNSFSGGYTDLSAYGLCNDRDDCEEGLGCDSGTNTCAACKTDSDCAAEYESYACNAESVCEKVQCVSDEDCILGVCLAGQHKCGDCRAAADCRASAPLCDTVAAKCVECLTDSDCKESLRPHCDARYGFCSI